MINDLYKAKKKKVILHVCFLGYVIIINEHFIYHYIYIMAEQKSEDILFIIPVTLYLKGKGFCFFAKTTATEYICNNPHKYEGWRDLLGR